jgi:glyceraldehyde 3-phosphate dehydrogenase
MHGFALRVPTPTVSVVDLVVNTQKNISVESVNDAFRAAEAGPMKGILGVCDEELVSVDYKGDSRSSIVDSKLTLAMGDKLLKVVSWYDNEWGYSCRVADLINYIAGKGL